MSETLDILIKNTSQGNLYAFLAGKYEDRLCIIRADGRTQYFPMSPRVTAQPLAENCTIDIGPPGSTKALQIPYLSAARIYFSIDAALDFLLAPGPNLIEPSSAYPSDSNFNKVWTFAEFTFNKDQLYANITYVDFVSIPVALALQTATGKTQTVKGLAFGGLDTIFSKLEEQHRIDGAPWDQLIVKTPDGKKTLRVLSPNLARISKPHLFEGYFEGYVSQVWDRFKKEPLTVDTQSRFGVVQGRVVNEVLTFPGVGTYPKPSTEDIFSNSTGPFRTDTDGYRALTPRIAAAFNRSELMLANAIPADPNVYYKERVTNHYSRILHEVNIDSRGYAFPYDDVTKTGETDLSGAVLDPDPILLTVTVGGTDAPPAAFDAKSHIRAERFSSHSGIKTEPTTDSEAGNNVGWIGNGDWLAFDQVNFDNYGVDSLNVRVASGQGGIVKGQIELRLDSLAGQTIASVEVANTGGWQSWTTKAAKLNVTVSGVHSVYMVFFSDRVEDFTNVNWFTFSKSTTVIGPGAYRAVGYFINWDSSGNMRTQVQAEASTTTWPTGKRRTWWKRLPVVT
ncbi:glycoside hydrolase family 18 protein [Rhypophila sp. PSN 637]